MPGFMLDTFAQFGTAESSRIEGFQLFKQGGSLFIICGSGSLTGFGDMQDDYGIVPYPKWTEDQERFYNPTSGGSLALPLSCSTDLERVCVIKEALAVESYKKVVPAVYNTMFANKYLRDSESYEMFNLIRQGLVYEALWTWGEGSDLVYALPNLMAQKSSDLSSYYEKRRKSTEKTINKFVEKVLELES